MTVSHKSSVCETGTPRSSKTLVTRARTSQGLGLHMGGAPSSSVHLTSSHVGRIALSPTAVQPRRIYLNSTFDWLQLRMHCRIFAGSARKRGGRGGIVPFESVAHSPARASVTNWQHIMSYSKSSPASASRIANAAIAIHPRRKNDGGLWLSWGTVVVSR